MAILKLRGRCVGRGGVRPKWPRATRLGGWEENDQVVVFNGFGPPRNSKNWASSKITRTLPHRNFKLVHGASKQKTWPTSDLINPSPPGGDNEKFNGVGDSEKFQIAKAPQWWNNTTLKNSCSTVVKLYNLKTCKNKVSPVRTVQSGETLPTLGHTAHFTEFTEFTEFTNSWGGGGRWPQCR